MKQLLWQWLIIGPLHRLLKYPKLLILGVANHLLSYGCPNCRLEISIYLSTCMFTIELRGCLVELFGHVYLKLKLKFRVPGLLRQLLI